MKARLTHIAAMLTGAVFLLATALDVAAARGGGRGGGGFSRSGPAVSGGFASGAGMQRGVAPSTQQAGTMQRSQPSANDRASRPQQVTDRQGQRQDAASTNQGSRQDNRTEAREDWQEHANAAREDRQDFYEDEVDDRWDNDWDSGDVAAGFVVGAVVGAAAAAPAATVYYSLPCTATAVVVSGTTYYQCGTAWYTPAYSGANVTYAVVSAPPGY
jgi:hypothetical protein